MLGLKDIGFAAELGSTIVAGTPSDTLTALASYMRADMAQLDVWDGFRATSISTIGVSPTIATLVCDKLPVDEVFGRYLFSSGTACLATDFGFRESSYYREHFEAVGIIDGVSMALATPQGSVVGLLHLASAEAAHFDEHHRQLLDALTPALAQAVTRPSAGVPIPPGYSVSRVRGDAVESVAYRPAATVTSDPVVLEIARRFGRQEVRTLRFLWRMPDGWSDVQLVREDGPDEAVIVACRRTVLPWQLTPRELEVLTALTTGATNRRIASMMGISERTVMTHVERILQKLNVPCRTTAAVRAVRDGTVLPSSDPNSPTFIERIVGVAPN
ncbi:response regulator transcription factor [Nocardia sp. CA-084685]|uniref:helix-turn-helix transcriptional regulator n=1 Tax=Nocardia sp. CA-084685 TaxID=3239970 RepID=UPI003D990796